MQLSCRLEQLRTNTMKKAVLCEPHRHGTLCWMWTSAKGWEEIGSCATRDRSQGWRMETARMRIEDVRFSMLHTVETKPHWLLCFVGGLEWCQGWNSRPPTVLRENRMQMTNSKRREKEIQRELGSKSQEGHLLLLVGCWWYFVLSFVVVVFLFTTPKFLFWVDVKALLQFFSSELSTQSFIWSHLNSLGMHWPSWQVNWSEPQVRPSEGRSFKWIWIWEASKQTRYVWACVCKWTHHRLCLRPSRPHSPPLHHRQTPQGCIPRLSHIWIPVSRMAAMLPNTKRSSC